MTLCEMREQPAKWLHNLNYQSVVAAFPLGFCTLLLHFVKISDKL
jgi:hypothetical protein